MPKSNKIVKSPLKLPQHPKVNTPIDKDKKRQAIEKRNMAYEEKKEKVKKMFPTKESVQLFKKQHDAHFEMIYAYDEKYNKEHPLLMQPCKVDDIQEVIHDSIDKHVMKELGYSTTSDDSEDEENGGQSDDVVDEKEGKTEKKHHTPKDNSKHDITLHDLLPEKLHAVARLPFLLGDAFEALDKKPTTANELDLHDIQLWMLIEDFLSAESVIRIDADSNVADLKKRTRFKKAILETFDDQDLERWGYAKEEGIQSLWGSRKNDKPSTLFAASVDNLASGVTKENVEEFIQMLSIHLFGC